MKSKKKQLYEVVEIQCADGNWNCDSYMHGLANGLLLAKSIIDNTAFNPILKPDKYLNDK